MASRIIWIAAAWFGRLGAKPPSSPTAVDIPFASMIFFNEAKTSAPQRNASRKDCALTGTIMNS